MDPTARHQHPPAPTPTNQRPTTELRLNGPLIRERRLQLGIPRRQLADTTGRSERWALSLETHPTATTVTIHDINLIANLIEVDPTTLLQPTTTNTTHNDTVSDDTVHTRPLPTTSAQHLSDALRCQLTGSASTNPTAHLTLLIQRDLIITSDRHGELTYSVAASIWHALDTTPSPPHALPIRRTRSTARQEALNAAKRIHASGQTTFTRHDIVTDVLTTGTRYRPRTIAAAAGRLASEHPAPLTRVAPGTYKLSSNPPALVERCGAETDQIVPRPPAIEDCR